MTEITKFANGLTLITERVENFESVVIDLWVQTGSRFELAGEEGICHFIEHMCFQGTNARNHIDISEAFDDVGGYFNAGTSRENTVFTAKILAEDTEIALDVIADVTINSVMKPELVKKEKKVIEQEISQSDDNPDEATFEKFMQNAFEGQDLGNSIIGTKETIAEFDQQKLRSFYKKHYNGGNIVIAIAGKIDPEQIKKIVEVKFNSLAAGELGIITPSIFTSKKLHITRPTLNQAHIVLGFKGLSGKHPDYYVQEIASNIFGGSTSSRLFNEIREKRGLSYNVSSFTMSFADNGIFGVNADVEMDRTEEFLRVVKEELQKIAEDLTDKELTRIRHQVKAAYLMSKESITNRTARLANNYIRYGRIVDTEEIVGKYLSYGLADVKAYFAKLAEKPDDYALVVMSGL